MPDADECPDIDLERQCNCLVPYFEGVGQHSPGCSIFTPEERAEHAEEARRRWIGRDQL